MSKNEMTRKEALSIAIERLSDVNDPRFEEAAGVLAHMLAQLSKPKTSTAGQPTKAGVKNTEDARWVFENAPDQFDCGWLVSHLNGCLTPQKAVAIAKAGISAGLFEKVLDGKKVAYRKVR